MDKGYFTKRPDIISLAVVTVHLAAVFAPVYIAAASSSVLVMVSCWFIFGISMHGIMNLMHECCHYHVFKAKSGSEVLGKYIIAPLAFADFEGYRKRHWDHHKFLGVEGETKDAYLIDISGYKAAALMLSYLFAEKAARMFLKQFTVKAQEDQQAPNGFSWIGTLVFVQAVFFGSILVTAYLFFSPEWPKAAVHAVAVYFFVYIYGLVSLTVLVANLRSIAEHQIFPDTDVHQGYAALRNFKCNIFTRYLMGSYGFSQHYTHHETPGIPYYNLKAKTDELARKDMAFMPKVGYFDLLGRIMSGGGPLKEGHL